MLKGSLHSDTGLVRNVNNDRRDPTKELYEKVYYHMDWLFARPGCGCPGPAGRGAADPNQETAQSQIRARGTTFGWTTRSAGTARRATPRQAGKRTRRRA